MLMSFCLTGAVYAQKGTIKGTVVDENGEPVIGANVVVKGTTNGTITDLDGNYVIPVENMKNVVLQVSYVGYNTVEEAVKAAKENAMINGISNCEFIAGDVFEVLEMPC